jgi:hypothetical protein
MDKPKPLPPLDVVLSSVAIRRIIEEVRADELDPQPGRYNRVYTRHNRS